MKRESKKLSIRMYEGKVRLSETRDEREIAIKFADTT